MNLFEEFEWRQLVQDFTEGAREYLSRNRITAYIGFDPTAESLHIGSLLPMLGLARLQRFGHRPIAIAGGGTGLIGDPSGKTLERQLLTKRDIRRNLEGIKYQLEKFLDFEVKSNPALMLDNADWLTKISFTDFMRDIGKHFTVNYMLAKDSVKRRIDSEEGISFTEFSYMLLQSYDFLYVFDNYDCTMQMGGSDQWGNIVAGIDLIRRLRSTKAYGLVFPLVTTSTGVKFGKTESGTIWLDGKLTSPYRFYQFWLNTDDRDVIRYLKYFTWLSREDIAEQENLLAKRPEAREAHRKLAEEVTRMVHGESELAKAIRASQILFGGAVEGVPLDDILDIFADVPSVVANPTEFQDNGKGLVELMTEIGVVNSRGEARRLIKAGGVYINNIRYSDTEAMIKLDDFIEGKVLIVRKGKKNYFLVRIDGD